MKEILCFDSLYHSRWFILNIAQNARKGKKKMSNKAYCVGLDIGTSSVGYAVTDINGRLLKHKDSKGNNRSLFGALIFDEAQTAAERRVKRSARRRLDRREQRIDHLQALMAQDIGQVDPVFFARLNESFLHDDDRKYPHLYGTLPESIWCDGAESKIPTIYHLRYLLANEQKKADIRYIYLALHHIIKYRGHFLIEGESLAGADTSVVDSISTVLALLSGDEYNYVISNGDSVIQGIKAVLQNQQLTMTRRA